MFPHPVGVAVEVCSDGWSKDHSHDEAFVTSLHQRKPCGFDDKLFVFFSLFLASII